MILNPIADSIWEIRRPLRVLGVPLGHRMTVVKLTSGDLWVHSPVDLDDAIRAALETLGGTPRYFVAPSAFHDLYWPPYFNTYADAQFHAVSGMPNSLPTFTHTLTDTSPQDWAADFEQIAIAGIPKLNECVFVHKPSRTLIVADLVFNFHHADSFYSRLFFKLNDVYQKTSPSRLFKSFIKDPKAMRETLDRVLACDFDRIIVGHGTNVETSGKAALEKAYSFL